MDLLANLLDVLVIVTVALAGIAGTGVLAAHRLNKSPESDIIPKNRIAERKK